MSKKVKHSDAVFEKCASMRKNIEKPLAENNKMRGAPDDGGHGLQLRLHKLLGENRARQISDSQRLSIYGIRDRVWVNLDAHIGDCGQNDPRTDLQNQGRQKREHAQHNYAENQGAREYRIITAKTARASRAACAFKTNTTSAGTANPIPSTTSRK